MCSARFSILAGTALALILTMPSLASAAPANSPSGSSPQPAARDYSTPGSMPKPSSMRPDDDGLRFRGSMPASGRLQPARREMATPLAPASNERPAPEPAPAKQPTPPAQPAPAVTEAPAPAPAAVVRQAPPAPVVQQAAPRPVVAAPSVAPGPVFSDGQIGDKIRELIASKQKFEQLIARKADRDAIAALYQKTRNFQPLWVSQGAPSERATDVIRYLRTIDADGLDPKDYPAPKFGGASAEAQAEAELKFTETVLTYSRHAMNGRVHFSRVSPNIDYKLAFDADDVLKKIAASNDLPKTLETFNPQQPAYAALKAKLAELRNEPEQDAARIDKGPVLKYFRDRNNREYIMNDARVPLLRERLGLAAEPNTAYNVALANAVGKFQKAHGIQVTGQLNQPTIDALNPPSRAKQIDAILGTMERWRWMPRDLGQTHVVLNIPDYHLRVYHDGEKVWQTKVVVGKPGHETPLLTETMKFITLNPTWNVPQSIIYNELLPIYETSDPQIFERQGLKMERNPRRHHPRLPAAGRAQRARPNPLQLPEQVPGLPARHAGEELLRTGEARLQPRLPARAGPAEICRGAAVLRIAEIRLHRRQHQADARRRGEAARLPQPDSGPSHLPDRVRGRGRQAAVPRRHLRARRQARVDPAQQRAAGGRYRDRAAGRPELQADPRAEPEVEQRGWRRQLVRLFKHLFR